MARDGIQGACSPGSRVPSREKRNCGSRISFRAARMIPPSFKAERTGRRTLRSAGRVRGTLPISRAGRNRSVEDVQKKEIGRGVRNAWVEKSGRTKARCAAEESCGATERRRIKLCRWRSAQSRNRSGARSTSDDMFGACPRYIVSYQHCKRTC